MDGRLLDEIWRVLEPHLEEKEKSKGMLRLMLQALLLFSRKQHDYSSLNILMGGDRGVFYRVIDKVMRLWSHYVLGKRLVNENLDDTWYDLSVYALIALLVRHGEWRPTPEELRALNMDGHLSCSPAD